MHRFAETILRVTRDGGVDQKMQSMNTFWRHIRNEIAGARNQTMILAALATFLAWIGTALLRAIFG
jgi:hypothetical protein